MCSFITLIKGETNQFVMKRFRQCHDLLHLLLDAPTNFEGESYVKAYEFHQTGFAVPLIGRVDSMENKSDHEFKIFEQSWNYPLKGFTAAPAYRLKSQAFNRHISRSLNLKTLPSDPLYLSFYFEERWEQPISDLRSELGLTEKYLFDRKKS